MSYEPEEMNGEEREEAQPAAKKNQPGTGTVFIFQIMMACLLIAAVVVLKTSFPSVYEDVKIKYYDLLNREMGFGAWGEGISGLIGGGDGDGASSHVPSTLEGGPDENESGDPGTSQETDLVERESSQAETGGEEEEEAPISSGETDDEVAA